MLNRVLQPFGIGIRRLETLQIPHMTRARIARLLYFHRMLDLIKNVRGDIVECGVGHGHGLLNWALMCQIDNDDRYIWGFDSFEGFPEPSLYDRSVRNPKKGEWSGTSVHDVITLLLASGIDQLFIQSHVTLVKGFFQESLVQYSGSSIALLHLDVDLHDSYRDALAHLYPQVGVGGVIMFDEYKGHEQQNFPGARKAIDEYFGNKKSTIQRDQIYGKYYLVKEAILDEQRP